MEILDSMKAALAPIGVYNLNNDNLILAELKAYAEGLNLVDNELKTLERECFISTAEDYGLLIREHLIGVSKNKLPIESRRAMLLYHGGVSEDDFTKKAIEDALVSCGIVATISEYPSEYKVYVNCVRILDTTITKDQIKNEVYKYLPPHLSVEFDFRNFSWNIIEGKELTFSAMDNKNKTWSYIDTYEEE